jgi:hypothetical protein
MTYLRMSFVLGGFRRLLLQIGGANTACARIARLQPLPSSLPRSQRPSAKPDCFGGWLLAPSSRPAARAIRAHADSSDAGTAVVNLTSP